MFYLINRIFIFYPYLLICLNYIVVTLLFIKLFKLLLLLHFELNKNFYICKYLY